MKHLRAGPALSCRNKDSFTLVEVVVALGIATLVVVALFPLIVGALRQSSDTHTRDQAVNMLPSLTSYLQEQQTFGSNYTNFQSLNGTNSALYLLVRYTNGSISVSPPGDTNRIAVIAPRDGPLVGVQLSLSSNNPVIPLPASLSAYTAAAIVLDARAYEVSNPSSNAPSTVGPPLYRSTIVISE
jgi:type II secretory pathway pseudopilin PulG